MIGSCWTAILGVVSSGRNLFTKRIESKNRSVQITGHPMRIEMISVCRSSSSQHFFPKKKGGAVLLPPDVG
jgi:hypothetical protein